MTGAIWLVQRSAEAGGCPAAEDIARLCSPRVERYSNEGVIFDASGLARVLGTPDHIGHEVQRLAAERQVRVRVAIAPTMTAAWLLARFGHKPVMVAEAGREADVLAALPVDAMLAVRDLVAITDDVRTVRVPRGRNFRAAPSPMRVSNTAFTKAHAQVLAVLARWGVRTFGDVAALPVAELRARFGTLGTRMHEVARGQDRQPLVPGEPARRFVDRLALEWPIEGLEPLSFVLARLCESLSKQLEQADRGAVSITTRLALVSKAGFERTLHLPAPMRDPKVLRTLILLDLEAHPIEPVAPADAHRAVESAGVDAVEIEVEVSPGRIAQGALFVRTLPTAESLATLVARLGALMGHTRVGAPELVDTFDEREIRQKTFVVREVREEVRGVREGEVREVQRPTVLRRWRQPKPLRMASLDVVAKAGPMRTSGKWWRRDGAAWDRDAWDLQLADGRLVRVSRNRLTNSWELEGTYD